MESLMLSLHCCNVVACDNVSLLVSSVSMLFLSQMYTLRRL